VRGNYIKTDVIKIGFHYMNWMKMAQYSIELWTM